MSVEFSIISWEANESGCHSPILRQCNSFLPNAMQNTMKRQLSRFEDDNLYFIADIYLSTKLQSGFDKKKQRKKVGEFIQNNKFCDFFQRIAFCSVFLNVAVNFIITLVCCGSQKKL